MIYVVKFNVIRSKKENHQTYLTLRDVVKFILNKNPLKCIKKVCIITKKKIHFLLAERKKISAFVEEKKKWEKIVLKVDAKKICWGEKKCVNFARNEKNEIKNYRKNILKVFFY